MINHMQLERIEKMAVLNEHVIKGQILFTGSSLMEQFPINELLMTERLPYIIYNRGVGGFRTEDMLMYMEEMVFQTAPSVIFINIGTNDIAALDYDQSVFLNNYRKILTQISDRLPDAKVYVMAYYPVNETDKKPEDEWGKTAFVNRNNPSIADANEEVRKLAEEFGFDFINVNEGLTDERGKLRKEFTVEGIHMYANAYRLILHNMKPYLEDSAPCKI